jgi:hypothetical protein
MWATVPFDVGRDYAMWASITVKQKMRPTSQRNPGPHHTGISGPLPTESLAHMDRNTQGCTESSKTSANDDYVGPCIQNDTSHEYLIFATASLRDFPADIRTFAPGMPKQTKSLTLAQ